MLAEWIIGTVGVSSWVWLAREIVRPVGFLDKQPRCTCRSSARCPWCLGLIRDE